MNPGHIQDTIGEMTISEVKLEETLVSLILGRDSGSMEF